jgi:hypothetical protein
MSMDICSITGRVWPYSLPMAVGAVLGLAIVCLLVQPIWNDQAWLLYAADRLLQGDRLYVDLLETNPPLTIWISTIPVAIASVIGTTSITGLVLCVALLAVCICVWCLHLYADVDRRRLVPWIAIILVYATIIQPSMNLLGGLRTDFAQREHIVALFLLPYLFAAARRFDRRPLSWLQSILVGLAAAVSLSLKPHNILIVACVEALLLYRSRHFYGLLRPELIVMAIGGLTYCVVVWLLTPEYMRETIPLLAAAYRYFEPASLGQMVVNRRNLIVEEIAAVAWLAGLRFMHRTSKVSGPVSVLLAAAAGAFMAFLVQGKDWSDHTLPAQIFVYSALAMLALDQFPKWVHERANPRTANRVAATVATIVVCLLAVTTYLPTRAAALERTQLKRELSELNNVTAALPAASPILVLTPGIELQFYFAITRGFVWASKSPCVWLQGSIANAELKSAGSQDHSLQPLPNQYTDLLLSSLRSDFDQWHPPIVLVLRCAGVECKENLDLVEWFTSRDPTFAATWSHYVRVEQIGRFDLFRRDNAGGAPEKAI